MSVLRMRTLEDAHAELVADDPGCALTKTALRRLVVSGAVRSVKIGRKYLVDMSALDDYLRGVGTETSERAYGGGGVRRVDLR